MTYDLSQVPTKLLDLPSDVEWAERALEEATFYRDMKKRFIETKRAGIILTEKAKNPKIPEYHVKAIAEESLHYEELELLEDESVVKQAQIELNRVQNQLMSARQLMKTLEKGNDL